MAVLIALGANLSNQDRAPGQTFIAALRRLSELGVSVQDASSLWKSPAWPAGSDQPDYINAAARVSTSLGPQDLLRMLHSVEAEFGRVRSVKNAARTLDLDLLDYDGRQIDAPDITIPHPRMLCRAFVLFPLQEVAPYWVDPKNKRAIAEWIARLPLSSVAPLSRIGRLEFTE
jgi:2-amino-4-hydroxy-6-hydroxymethyldihydropteridine diphosphokinase